jgi:hypothetical protein
MNKAFLFFILVLLLSTFLLSDKCESSKKLKKICKVYFKIKKMKKFKF